MPLSVSSSAGFYLTRSGFRSLQALIDLPRTINFYLDYSMSDPVLDEEWRIYVPKALLKA